MKKLFVLPLLLVLFFVLGITWFYKNVQAPSGDKGTKFFLIEKGTSATQIGKNLEADGLVKSALAFKIYIQFTGQSNKLQSGEFQLSSGYTLFQTVNALTSGPVELWVTVPEGLRREEVAQRFAKGLDRDAGFVDEFLSLSKGDEGTLFPDTYLFPRDASPSAIVAKMTKTFELKTSNLKATPPLSFSQRVVLASIIERETKTVTERPVVAGILLNRLNLGMALQVDAAVQYAVGTKDNWWPILTKDDLQINSAYNTYKLTGLPPAPISNPGLTSLRAAFEPEQTDYLFYIHDSTGSIHYAKTLAEHNANISKYLGK